MSSDNLVAPGGVCISKHTVGPVPCTRPVSASYLYAVNVHNLQFAGFQPNAYCKMQFATPFQCCIEPSRQSDCLQTTWKVLCLRTFKGLSKMLLRWATCSTCDVLGHLISRRTPIEDNNGKSCFMFTEIVAVCPRTQGGPVARVWSFSNGSYCQPSECAAVGLSRYHWIYCSTRHTP